MPRLRELKKVQTSPLRSHFAQSNSRWLEVRRLVIPAVLGLFAVGCAHSRPQAAAAPQAPPVQFVSEWGMKGDGPGQFDDPVGPAIDVDQRVYFADRAARFVQKFDLRGTPLLSFENDAARGASAIAVDSGGAIYVADARAGAIQVFFPEGPLLRVLRVAPQRNLEGPFGFSVAADGRAYVPDPAEARIQVLSSNGRMERTWRLPFSARNAAGRPIAAIAGSDGFVYVCDAGTARIVKFTSSGEQAAAWQDPEGPEVALLGLAVASKYVFVLRAANPHLQIWTTDGHSVLTDDLGGRLNASSPAKLSFAVDPRGDMIVLDSGVPRVLQFSIHLDSL
jgi:hypothetical protein